MDKWCTYCRKADHNDSECWCTRMVSDVTPRAQPVGALKTQPTKIWYAVMAAMRGS